MLDNYPGMTPFDAGKLFQAIVVLEVACRIDLSGRPLFWILL